jgi:hypothetical protein
MRTKYSRRGHSRADGSQSRRLRGARRYRRACSLCSKALEGFPPKQHVLATRAAQQVTKTLRA